jgi:hypothetical protein
MFLISKHSLFSLKLWEFWDKSEILSSLGGVYEDYSTVVFESISYGS